MSLYLQISGKHNTIIHRKMTTKTYSNISPINRKYRNEQKWLWKCCIWSWCTRKQQNLTINSKIKSKMNKNLVIPLSVKYKSFLDNLWRTLFNAFWIVKRVAPNFIYVAFHLWKFCGWLSQSRLYWGWIGTVKFSQRWLADITRQFTFIEVNWK